MGLTEYDSLPVEYEKRGRRRQKKAKAAHGYFHISGHAANRMAQRDIWRFMIKDTLAAGTRRMAYESGKGALGNAVNS